jgi:hypothetical protein
MKFSDITGNDVSTLTEAPMGFMKTLGTAAKAMNPFSLSGRSQAQGQIKTGVSANQIYAQYYNWLGQSGTTADTDSVIAFLQQNGYGEQAITAAQNKFPKVPQQPTAVNTSTTGTSATPSTAPNQKLTPQQQNALKAKMQGQRQSGVSTAAQAGTGFKNYVAGSGQRIQGANPDGSPKVVTVQRESKNWLNEAGIALDKNQLSAIFTAVAQSGAVPQQNTTSGNTGTTGQDDDDTPSSSSGPSGGSSNDAGSSGNSGKSSQLPNRLTPDDILQYYARLTSPYEREQVKKGIPEVDKQLSQRAQQATK